MTFSADTLLRDANRATTADADIAAACHGIMDTELQQTGGAWYGPVNDALNDVKTLARRWLTDYQNLFRSEVLTDLRDQAQAVMAVKPTITEAFQVLEQDPTGDKQPVTNLLNQMKLDVAAVAQPIATYEKTLQDWGDDLRPAQEHLNQVIAQVQADASHLQSEINAINGQITMLQGEITKGRKAIDDAQSHRTSGILETIFGVVLAPFTFGTSLVLAGVGVASIVEAEAQINAMEDQIRRSQNQIHSLAGDLNADQAQIATLQGLLIPAQGASDSVALIEQRLVDMRATLDGFTGEVAEVIHDVDQATSSHTVVVAESWADAAFNEWSKAIDGLSALIAQSEAVHNDPVRATSATSDNTALFIRPKDGAPKLPGQLSAATITQDGETGAPVLQVGKRRYWLTNRGGDHPGVVLAGVTNDNRVRQLRQQPGLTDVASAALSGDGTSLDVTDSNGHAVTIPLAKLAL